MIYTITLNPSLDYYLRINKLNTGEINRSNGEEYDAAGKGVNVSKFLDLLNTQSIALGFLGGFNKDYYLQLLLDHKDIQPQFTTTKENTRINVKVSGNEETSLNAKGPCISDEEYAKFSKRLKSIYDNDYVVLSGNVQEDIREKIVKDIKELINDGIKVVLDTDNTIVDELIYDKPFLVKMSNSSIGTDEEKILAKGKELVSKGVKYFMYSAPKNMSYLVENNHYYKCDIKDKTPFSLTSTNDAMIAGFLWASLKGANALEAFTYANAVTISSNILCDHIDIGDVNESYDKLVVEKIDY